MELIINGVRVENVTYMNIQYRTGDVAPPAPDPDPTPDPTPDPEPTPPPPPAPDQPCGALPPGVVIAGTIDLNDPNGMLRVALAQETKSFKVITTSNPASFGMFSFAAVSGTETTTRIAWISKCPGAPGYPETIAASSRCVATGTESTVIGWAQYAKRGECVLEPNSVYYLNVRNASPADPNGSTCPDGASHDLYLNVYK